MRKKILIIAPVWIGDVVMAQALMRFLKKRNPNCFIDVFAREYLHPVLRRMPEVDNCLLSTFKPGELNLKGRFMVAREIRKHSYTHVYVLPNSFKAALIPFWAKIPHRIGWCGEQRYFLINDMRFSRKKLDMEVKRFVALGSNKKERFPKDFPLPRLKVFPEAVETVLDRLQMKLTGKPILAISPGAGAGDKKCWPSSHYAFLAKKKIEEGWEVWILGGTKEQILAKEIQKHCYGSCVDLTGKTDLGEVVDLISVVSVVVANDSGLMHVASALNKPVIAIYGPTSPLYAPPLTKKSRSLSLNMSCSPCRSPECLLKDCRTKSSKCLYDLKPEMVLQAMTDVVGI